MKLKTLLLAALLTVDCGLWTVDSSAQTTTNNPGVPIFGAGGMDSLGGEFANAEASAAPVSEEIAEIISKRVLRVETESLA